MNSEDKYESETGLGCMACPLWQQKMDAIQIGIAETSAMARRAGQPTPLELVDRQLRYYREFRALRAILKRSPSLPPDDLETTKRREIKAHHQELEEWADKLEKVNPEMARKVRLFLDDT